MNPAPATSLSRFFPRVPVVVLLLAGSMACPRLVGPPPEAGLPDAAVPPLPVVTAVHVEAVRKDAGPDLLLAYQEDAITVEGQHLDAVAGVVRVGTRVLDLLPVDNPDDGGTRMRARLPRERISGPVSVTTRNGTGNPGTQTVTVLGPGHPADPVEVGTVEPLLGVLRTSTNTRLCGPRLPRSAGEDTSATLDACFQRGEGFNAFASAFTTEATFTGAGPLLVTAFDALGEQPVIHELEPPAGGVHFPVQVAPVQRPVQDGEEDGPSLRPRTTLEPAVLRFQVTDAGAFSSRLTVGDDDVTPSDGVLGFAPLNAVALATAEYVDEQSHRVAAASTLSARDGGPPPMPPVGVNLRGYPAALATLGQGQDAVTEYLAAGAPAPTVVMDLACERAAAGPTVLFHRVTPQPPPAAPEVRTARRAVPLDACGADAGPLPPGLRARCVATAVCGAPCRALLDLATFDEEELLQPVVNTFQQDGGATDAGDAVACRDILVDGGVKVGETPGCRLPDACRAPQGSLQWQGCRQAALCALDPACNASAVCQLDQQAQGGAPCGDVACHHALCDPVLPPDGGTDVTALDRLLTFAPGVLLLSPLPGQPSCAVNTYSQRITPLNVPLDGASMTSVAVPGRASAIRRLFVLPPSDGLQPTRQMLVADLEAQSFYPVLTRAPYAFVHGHPFNGLAFALPAAGSRVDLLKDDGNFLRSSSLLGTPLDLRAEPSGSGGSLVIHAGGASLLDGAGRPRRFVPTPGAQDAFPYALAADSPWDMPRATWLPDYDEASGVTTLLRVDLGDTEMFGQVTERRPVPPPQGWDAVYGVPVFTSSRAVLALLFTGKATAAQTHWAAVPATGDAVLLLEAGPVSDVEPQVTRYPMGVHPQSGTVVFLDVGALSPQAPPCTAVAVGNMDTATATLAFDWCPGGRTLLPLQLAPHPAGDLLGFFQDPVTGRVELGAIRPDRGYVSLQDAGEEAPLLGSVLCSPDGRKLYVGSSGLMTEMELVPRADGTLHARAARRLALQGQPDVMTMDAEGTRLLYADRERQDVWELR